jgi:hypothetical protein
MATKEAIQIQETTRTKAAGPFCTTRLCGLCTHSGYLLLLRTSTVPFLTCTATAMVVLNVFFSLCYIDSVSLSASVAPKFSPLYHFFGSRH